MRIKLSEALVTLVILVLRIVIVVDTLPADVLTVFGGAMAVVEEVGNGDDCKGRTWLLEELGPSESLERTAALIFERLREDALVSLDVRDTDDESCGLVVKAAAVSLPVGLNGGNGVAVTGGSVIIVPSIANGMPLSG